MKEGYKKTELGWIPETWNVCTLSEISLGKGQYGIGASATEYVDGKPRYLRITDIGDSSNILNNDIKGLDDKNCNDYLLSEGDIVFARTGNTTGKSYVYDRNDGELVYAGFLIKFKINNKIADHRFIKYIIQSKRYWDWVNVMSTRSGQPGINSNEYGLLKIQIPSLDEQKKISDVLSRVDLQIEDTDKIIEKTKELKKGLMQRLLTKGIGHKEFKKSEVGEIPVEWEVELLGDLFKLSSGEGLSQKNIVSGDYPVYGGNGVNGYHNEYLFKESKVIIGRVGAKCGCVHKSYEKSWITDNALYISNKKKSFNDDYMIHLLKFIDLNKYANKNAQPVISGEKIYSIRIAMPDVNEQDKIVEILLSVDTQIEGYENKKAKLEELKKGLMQQLLTGKIRVI